MKTFIGVVLALCVSSAVCQLSPTYQCLIDTVLPTDLNSECQSTLARLNQFSQFTDSDLDELCPDPCVASINSIWQSKCGISVVDLFCSRDNNGYCLSLSGGFRLQLQINAASRVCSAGGCVTNPGCSAAIENLSCCGATLGNFADVFTSDGTSNSYKAALERVGCSESDGPSACAGGMAVFAMPVAILTALFAALAVIF